MEKILVLFNHKGGVSKTTTTFNLAWKLTQLGKRVLLVDGDPQCNLTGLFLGNEFDDYYEDERTCHNNIKDAVSMAFNGKPQPIEAIKCPKHVNNSILYLIPGHMDLSEYESPLNLALNSNNAIVTLQNLPGTFYELIQRCCNEYSIDYVFIDMNPGLSALNQVFFIYSDAFIVPTNPDPFSVMALKTLCKTLPRWKKWAQQGRELFSESSYPLPEKRMLFLGLIIQRFSIRNHVPARPYTAKITEIKEYVRDIFSVAMKNNDMMINSGNVGDERNDICLGEIAEFGSLLQRATEAMLPVYALDRKTMAASGNVYDSMEAKRAEIDSIFDTIATTVLGTINA